MPVPSQPANLLQRPFAAEGNYTLVPDAPGTAGRASLQNGFPQETQLPLAQGGIAPNRTDFNGILYMLSAFAFWQQSGGMFSYRAALNYATPAVVYHNDLLWWCVAANGPEVSGVGAKEPGAEGSEAYWIDFLQKLAGGSAASLGGDVGDIKMHYGDIAPAGWLACDGSAFSATAYPKLYAKLGSAFTPDMRGRFVRGYDPAGTVDPDGTSRAVGSRQADATRRITAGFVGMSAHNAAGYVYGAVEASDFLPGFAHLDTNSYIDRRAYVLDTSLTTPTSTENRPVNIALLFCIKHD